MKEQIVLKPMTREMYHAYFREYESEISGYHYDESAAEQYIQRQFALKRIPFAIMLDEEMIGELKIYDIANGKSATLGIEMKNKNYMGRGFGTQAERLAVEYVFYELDIPILYADVALDNTRSQHVLEKVGFRLISKDEKRKHFQIKRIGN